MELTAEQNAKVKDLCAEIHPGEYGRVVIAFTGTPHNYTQITGEKQYRFHSEDYVPTHHGKPKNRQNSGSFQD